MLEASPLCSAMSWMARAVKHGGRRYPVRWNPLQPAPEGYRPVARRHLMALRLKTPKPIRSITAMIRRPPTGMSAEAKGSKPKPAR